MLTHDPCLSPSDHHSYRSSAACRLGRSEKCSPAAGCRCRPSCAPGNIAAASGRSTTNDVVFGGTYTAAMLASVSAVVCLFVSSQCAAASPTPLKLQHSTSTVTNEIYAATVTKMKSGIARNETLHHLRTCYATRYSFLILKDRITPHVNFFQQAAKER